MLFLQGTRDDLADLTLVREVCGGLGDRVTLHVVEGADHSFGVLKRSGRTGSEVLDELADTIAGRLGGWSGKPRKMRPATSSSCRAAAAWDVIRPPSDLPPANSLSEGRTSLARATAARTVASRTPGGSGRRAPG